MTSNAPAMGWEEWMRHDATSLAGLVRSGQLQASEVVAQAARGVERVNGRLAGVLEVFQDVVEDPARDRPARDGRLHGVPIFLKDLGSRLKGRRQESGSRLLAGNVSKDTDPLVENFLAAGLVPLGRSTTPEFGMTFDTSTSYLGHVNVTRNPWNTGRTPGGSSGGSAAMVAAGVTPISMASDGGGSTRIPASFCGLVGLKASRGRMAMPLAHNEFTWRIAVEGVVTRSVRDSAAAMDYLPRMPNGGSFYPMARFAGSYVDVLARPTGRLRIALSTGAWGRPGTCDPEVADKVRGVARLLEGMRHEVAEIDDARICDWEAMWRGYVTQWICGRVLYQPIAETGGMDGAAMLAALTPMVRRHFEAAQRYSTLDLYKAMACNNVVTRGFGRLMDSWDLLLCPTLAVRVPEANGPYSLLRDEDLGAWMERLSSACRYTMPGNEAGLPGISIPAGFDSDGMPVGAMLYANFGREDLLLAVAARIEEAMPGWFARTPPLNVASPG
jgi:Asp-tRNA(Asn)/Glu-tRNA(Gln) amidotransferase A subunit family amidase